MMRSRLLPGLALGLLLLAAPLQAADNDRFLPRDTTAVVMVNTRQLQQSVLFKKHLQPLLDLQKQNNENLRKGLTALERVLDLDPFKDLYEITLATTSEPGQLFFLVHGTFDLDKIDRVAGEFAKNFPDQLKITLKDKIPFYDIANPDLGPHQYAAFLDSDTLVISNVEQLVTDAVSRFDPPTAPTREKQVTALLQQIDHKKSFCASVLLTDEARKLLNKDGKPQVNQVLNKIRGATLSLQVTDGLQLEAMLQATDMKAAADLQALLELGRNLLNMAASNGDPRAQQLVVLLNRPGVLRLIRRKDALLLSSKIPGLLLDKSLPKFGLK